jgi:hypothetical protein
MPCIALLGVRRWVRVRLLRRELHAVRVACHDARMRLRLRLRKMRAMPAIPIRPAAGSARESPPESEANGVPSNSQSHHCATEARAAVAPTPRFAAGSRARIDRRGGGIGRRRTIQDADGPSPHAAAAAAAAAAAVVAGGAAALAAGGQGRGLASACSEERMAGRGRPLRVVARLVRRQGRAHASQAALPS